MEPDLLLLDEPFSALDAPTREDLERIIISLHHESNITCIIVTHDIEAAVVMGKKILTLRDGFNRKPRVLEKMILSVRSLGAGRRALFRYVYFPASLPAVLTALRVSAATAIAVLFIVEQSLTTYGLGYYIVVETYQVLRYPEMFTGILAMSLLGLALYFVIYNLELRFCRYQEQE